MDEHPLTDAQLFTVDEANDLLPTLIPILTHIMADHQELMETRLALAALTAAMRGNGHRGETARLEKRIASLVGSVHQALHRIARFGVEVKDLETGLIDFRSNRDGRVVYLCWRLGEGRIAFWHDLDAGFAGRQPL